MIQKPGSRQAAVAGCPENIPFIRARKYEKRYSQGNPTTARLLCAGSAGTACGVNKIP